MCRCTQLNAYPAISCESSKPGQGQDGQIAQFVESEAGRGRARNGIGESRILAGMVRDVNRSAGLALRQPAHFSPAKGRI
jgi:hypothetical protein